jgi:hypothetical protein
MEEGEIIASGYAIYNMVNIYIAEIAQARTTYSDEIMSWYNEWVPSCASESHYIIMSHSTINNASFPHEMGHFFDLWHTYEQILNIENNNPPYESFDL